MLMGADCFLVQKPVVIQYLSKRKKKIAIKDASKPLVFGEEWPGCYSEIMLDFNI